jgi:hypothetical protein
VDQQHQVGEIRVIWLSVQQFHEGRQQRQKQEHRATEVANEYLAQRPTLIDLALLAGVEKCLPDPVWTWNMADRIPAQTVGVRRGLSGSTRMFRMAAPNSSSGDDQEEQDADDKIQPKR